MDDEIGLSFDADDAKVSASNVITPSFPSAIREKAGVDERVVMLESRVKELESQVEFYKNHNKKGMHYPRFRFVFTFILLEGRGKRNDALSTFRFAAASRLAKSYLYRPLKLNP